jgi:TRAP-type C4-dicarboxylate transport system substrate-binding protein
MIIFEAIPFLRKSTKAASILIVILIFLILGCQVLAEPSEQHIIKLATLAPEGSPWMNTLHKINDEIKKKTGGKVKLKVYPPWRRPG